MSVLFFSLFGCCVVSSSCSSGYLHIYIYVYIYIHTHTYTYIQIHCKKLIHNQAHTSTTLSSLQNNHFTCSQSTSLNITKQICYKQGCKTREVVRGKYGSAGILIVFSIEMSYVLKMQYLIQVLIIEASLSIKIMCIIDRDHVKVEIIRERTTSHLIWVFK